MILLFDTNIILDIIEAREPFFQSSLAAVKQAAVSRHKCLFSASSVKDIFYLVKHHTGSAEPARAAVTQLSTLVCICDTSAEDIKAAIALKMTDFEDAVLAATARRENAEYIITRNTADFTGSPVEAVTPDDFLVKMAEER
jgi:predicted nucleic acid-binding protein